MTQQPYIPCWARPESPTRTMSERDAITYYKAHRTEDDITFYLLTQADSLSKHDCTTLAILAGQLADTKKASTRKWIAQEVRRIIDESLRCRGYIGPYEQQRITGQRMADDIDARLADAEAA